MKQSGQRWSRRKLLRTSATLTGLLLVNCTATAAPAPASTASPISDILPAGEEAKITYWTFWANRWGELQQEIVDAYNADSQDGIQVEMVIVPWGELSTQLMAAVSAGDPPDFTVVNRSEVVEWAVRKGVASLNDYLAASTECRADDWFAVAWNECVWRGQVYAQPFESGAYAAWYNRELFETAGLVPYSPPLTWSEVDIVAAQLTQGNADAGYTTVGFIPWLAPRNLLGWLSGGEWYDEANQTITAVTPENIAALAWVKQYADLYHGEALEHFRQNVGASDSVDDPFYRGQIAMVWKGSWSLSAKQEYAPDLAFGIHPLPYRAETGNDSLSQGSACVLPMGSPYPELAYKFLTYMSIHGIAHWAPIAADLVSRKDQTGIYPSLLPDNVEFRGYWKLYNQALSYAHHEPAMPARRFWNDQLDAAIAAVVRGLKEPAQALQDAQDATQRELDRALGKG
jgi:multiple sugar transport system substrate-binding protein